MPTSPAVTVSDLIFVGRGGYALALHRDTGQIVWSNNQLRSGYTTLLLDGDRLIVSTNGYLYGLDPLTGAIRWENPLSGYGVGVTTMASTRGGSPAGNDAATAEAEQDDDQRRSQQSNSNP